MSNLKEFNRISEEFEQVADFITIYIEEAHPVEDGYFTGTFHPLVFFAQKCVP